MKNMGDYHDHYLRKDVLLLADVYKTFIDTCLKCYGLDPCHYYFFFNLKIFYILFKIRNTTQLNTNTLQI